MTCDRNSSQSSLSRSLNGFGGRRTFSAGFDSEFLRPSHGLAIDPYSFRILITGGSSGLVETITDAVSIHSIKKAEYAKRLAQGQLGHVTLLDHFISVRRSLLRDFEVRDPPCLKSYGDPSSAKFARAQRNFAKSLAGMCHYPSQ